MKPQTPKPIYWLQRPTFEFRKERERLPINRKNKDCGVHFEAQTNKWTSISFKFKDGTTSISS